MDRDLSDLLIETYGATINDIVNVKGDLKIDTFSHSLKLSSCMMEFVDYLRKIPTESLTKKIKEPHNVPPFHLSLMSLQYLSSVFSPYIS